MVANNARVFGERLFKEWPYHFPGSYLNPVCSHSAGRPAWNAGLAQKEKRSSHMAGYFDWTKSKTAAAVTSVIKNARTGQALLAH